MSTTLRLERKSQADTGVIVPGAISITPTIDEDYWAYRVGLTEAQALLGFPKFGTIGIGFAVEDYDWNRNLPSTCETEKIFKHIWPNAGPGVAEHVVLEAIVLIQQAVEEDQARA